MKKWFLKVAALSVAFTFIVTSIDPVAFASSTAAGEMSPFSSKTLSIPAEFGQVTDMITGDSSAPAFIHIQSAHGNYEAEKNIEKLLGFIEKNSSVKLMLLEGAANKLHPELFRIFPKHPDFNRKVTDKLMQEGYLTGPESFLIESSKKSEGFGVEDLDAYKADRDAFISVVKKEKSSEKFLGSLRASIDKRFASKLNKNLLNLVRQEEALGSGTVSFEAWLKALGEASKKHLKLDLADAFYQDQYPFLIRYYRLQAIGSKINRDKAHAEAATFLNELEKRKVSKDILSSFKTILTAPESGLQKTENGYSTLRHAFDGAFTKLPRDFSMKAWPAWTLYAQYVILIQELEAKGLHEETGKLKDRILEVLAKTPAEKEYLSKARELYLLKRLFELELTRTEYEELLTRHITAAELDQSKGTGQFLALIAEAMRFYGLAVDREHKMFRNALKRMGELKQNRAVIVTGGFHAEGLKQLAASKGCSYIQITPRITEISKHDHEVYLRSMLGKREFETSQIAALLGLSSRAQRITVTGNSQTVEWLATIRGLNHGLISNESVLIQDALTEDLAHSSLLSSSTGGPAAVVNIAPGQAISTTPQNLGIPHMGLMNPSEGTKAPMSKARSEARTEKVILTVKGQPFSLTDNYNLSLDMIDPRKGAYLFTKTKDGISEYMLTFRDWLREREMADPVGVPFEVIEIKGTGNQGSVKVEITRPDVRTKSRPGAELAGIAKAIGLLDRLNSAEPVTSPQNILPTNELRPHLASLDFQVRRNAFHILWEREFDRDIEGGYGAVLLDADIISFLKAELNDDQHRATKLAVAKAIIDMWEMEKSIARFVPAWADVSTTANKVLGLTGRHKLGKKLLTLAADSSFITSVRKAQADGGDTTEVARLVIAVFDIQRLLKFPDLMAQIIEPLLIFTRVPFHQRKHLAGLLELSIMRQMFRDQLKSWEEWLTHPVKEMRITDFRQLRLFIDLVKERSQGRTGLFGNAQFGNLKQINGFGSQYVTGFKSSGRTVEFKDPQKLLGVILRSHETWHEIGLLIETSKNVSPLVMTDRTFTRLEAGGGKLSSDSRFKLSKDQIQEGAFVFSDTSPSHFAMSTNQRVQARTINGDVVVSNESGTELGRYHHSDVTALAVSPEGTFVVSSGNGRIDVWDVAQGRENVSHPNKPDVTQITFTGNREFTEDSGGRESSHFIRPTRSEIRSLDRLEIIQVLTRKLDGSTSAEEAIAALSALQREGQLDNGFRFSAPSDGEYGMVIISHPVTNRNLKARVSDPADIWDVLKTVSERDELEQFAVAVASTVRQSRSMTKLLVARSTAIILALVVAVDDIPLMFRVFAGILLGGWAVIKLINYWRFNVKAGHQAQKAVDLKNARVEFFKKIVGFVVSKAKLLKRIPMFLSRGNKSDSVSTDTARRSEMRMVNRVGGRPYFKLIATTVFLGFFALSAFGQNLRLSISNQPPYTVKISLAGPTNFGSYAVFGTDNPQVASFYPTVLAASNGAAYMFDYPRLYPELGRFYRGSLDLTALSFNNYGAIGGISNWVAYTTSSGGWDINYKVNAASIYGGAYGNFARIMTSRTMKLHVKLGREGTLPDRINFELKDTSASTIYWTGAIYNPQLNGVYELSLNGSWPVAQIAVFMKYGTTGIHTSGRFKVEALYLYNPFRSEVRKLKSSESGVVSSAMPAVTLHYELQAPNSAAGRRSEARATPNDELYEKVGMLLKDIQSALTGNFKEVGKVSDEMFRSKLGDQTKEFLDHLIKKEYIDSDFNVLPAAGAWQTDADVILDKQYAGMEEHVFDALKGSWDRAYLKPLLGDLKQEASDFQRALPSLRPDQMEAVQRSYQQLADDFKLILNIYILQTRVNWLKKRLPSTRQYSDSVRRKALYQLEAELAKNLIDGATLQSVEALRQKASDIQRIEKGIIQIEQDLNRMNNVVQTQGQWKNWLNQSYTPFDLNPDSYRDYDFRDVGAFRPGRTFFTKGLALAQMGIKLAGYKDIDEIPPEERTVLITRDARQIESENTDALVAALRYSGLNVVYTGADPDCVTSYSWAAQRYKPLMSIFMTASHVSAPEDFIVRGAKVAIRRSREGNLLSLTVPEIKETARALEEAFLKDPASMSARQASTPGTFKAEDIKEETIRFNVVSQQIAFQGGSLYAFGERLKKEDPLQVLAEMEKQYGQSKPFWGRRIGVEGSHTPSGRIAAETFKRLGADFVLLNGDVTEVFGPHKADPSIEKNLDGLKTAIADRQLDFGIAFDLDGDRGAILVPVMIYGKLDHFEVLSPDNLMVMSYPSLIKAYGYKDAIVKDGKILGIIKEVLGTEGITDLANELNEELKSELLAVLRTGDSSALDRVLVKAFTTNTGYVFLKAKKAEMEEQGYIFPIYGESSGHCWLHFTGEFENPLAVGALFALIAQKNRAGDEMDFDVYQRLTEKYAYSQMKRSSPLISPQFLQELSNWINSDPAEPKLGIRWKFDPNSTKNPPQDVIALARSKSIEFILDQFKVGKIFKIIGTNAGPLTVERVDTAIPSFDRKGLYSYADIYFKNEAGKIVGHIAWRASSNDPLYLASYEAKGRGAQPDKIRKTLGRIMYAVLGEKHAIMTMGDLQERLPHLTTEAQQLLYAKGGAIED